MADPSRCQDFCRFDATYPARPPPHRGPLPLPIPPRLDKALVPATGGPDAAIPKDSSQTQMDKFASLRAYRRARGL